jgi:GAF domain-containing protein
MLESAMDLAGRLLALAAAVRADGGDAVIRALTPMLRDAAPFDAGEVALACPVGFDRWTLTGDASTVAAEDFLLHLTARKHVIRIDDRPSVEAFKRTHAAMQQAGLRSLLALPLVTGGGLEGAIVLARSYPWAFVAAPLASLVPLAGMSALALEQSRALARLETELARPRPQAPERPPGDVDEALRMAAEAEERLAKVEAERVTLLEGIERREAELLRLKAELESLRHAPRRSPKAGPAKEA